MTTMTMTTWSSTWGSDRPSSRNQGNSSGGSRNQRWCQRIPAATTRRSLPKPAVWLKRLRWNRGCTHRRRRLRSHQPGSRRGRRPSLSLNESAGRASQRPRGRARARVRASGSSPAWLPSVRPRMQRRKIPANLDGREWTVWICHNYLSVVIHWRG